MGVGIWSMKRESAGPEPFLMPIARIVWGAIFGFLVICLEREEEAMEV